MLFHVEVEGLKAWWENGRAWAWSDDMIAGFCPIGRRRDRAFARRHGADRAVGSTLKYMPTRGARAIEAGSASGRS